MKFDNAVKCLYSTYLKQNESSNLKSETEEHFTTLISEMQNKEWKWCSGIYVWDKKCKLHKITYEIFLFFFKWTNCTLFSFQNKYNTKWRNNHFVPRGHPGH